MKTELLYTVAFTPPVAGYRWMIEWLLIAFAVFVFAGSSFASDVMGKFDGQNTQKAIVKSVGRNAISIIVNNEQWYFSPVGTFNISQVIGQFVSGDFNGDDFADIVCAYDYGNFNVGFVVFLSTGSEFKSSLWFSSGVHNLNPSAFAGNVSVTDNNQDGLSDLIVPYVYPNNIRSDLVFYSNGNKFYK